MQWQWNITHILSIHHTYFKWLSHRRCWSEMPRSAIVYVLNCMYKMKLGHYQTGPQTFSCKNVPFSSDNFTTSILLLAFVKKKSRCQEFWYNEAKAKHFVYWSLLLPIPSESLCVLPQSPTLHSLVVHGMSCLYDEHMHASCFKEITTHST